MTNQSDSPKKELDELLERLANRELTSADNAHLEEQLTSDAFARQSYIYDSVFEAMLSYEFPSQEAVTMYQLEPPQTSWLSRNMVGLFALELTLDCGAVVSLVGPAKLDLQSDYRAFLHFGGLSAYVPQEAVGFIVQTPNSHGCNTYHCFRCDRKQPEF